MGKQKRMRGRTKQSKGQLNNCQDRKTAMMEGSKKTNDSKKELMRERRKTGTKEES